MAPLMLIALIAGLPVLFAIILRVNTFYLFMSITSGYLLTVFVGDTAALTARSFIQNDQTDLITKLILFSVPVILSLIFLRKSLPRRQFPLQLVPLIGNGALLLVLIMPLMTAGVQGSIMSSPVGRTVHQASDVVVAGVVLLHLILLWIVGRPGSAKGKHHK